MWKESKGYCNVIEEAIGDIAPLLHSQIRNIESEFLVQLASECKAQIMSVKEVVSSQLSDRGVYSSVPSNRPPERNKLSPYAHVRHLCQIALIMPKKT